MSSRQTIVKQIEQLLAKRARNKPRQLLLCLNDSIILPKNFRGTVLNVRLREGEILPDDEEIKRAE